ncbi:MULTISPECIES: maleylpyruvate isomerase family mycothiol-dependent enzyme [Streptomyces]|uniref:Maleylpyruvate isomerase family mycothiol-dependent enzyme n=1 Tax=Streptomyces luteosporeus TaxID=173856 RepID=A0ABP6G066_9ACTN
MTALSFERHCAEILAQTALLRSHVHGADADAPVPTCPEWTLGQLLRHLGGAHRWAETAVRTRAQEPVPDTELNTVPQRTGEDLDPLGSWLEEGAALLAGTLRTAGPAAPVWSPVPEESARYRCAGFWARRMAHETAVHRADAALAVGAEFALEAEVARDAVEEWLGFAGLPEAYEAAPGRPGLLGPGRTLHFHATGARPADWFVDLTGTAPVVRPAPADATVVVHGSLTDLLLFLYRRPAPDVHVTGDAGLLALWLDRTGFWLQEE